VSVPTFSVLIRNILTGGGEQLPQGCRLFIAHRDNDRAGDCFIMVIVGAVDLVSPSPLFSHGTILPNDERNGLQSQRLHVLDQRPHFRIQIERPTISRAVMSCV
jgi:hypothetical protein